MSIFVPNKEAYPYLTHFKKEPFRSFVLIKNREIGNFYLKDYDKVINFYQYFNKNLFSDKTLNLENVYWFLLLRKYLKKDKKENQKELFEFIRKCEFPKGDKLGFKFSPKSIQREPDIWSTYFALGSLKLLGLLKEHLLSQGQNLITREIKNFILAHKKNSKFLHCMDKECEICKSVSPTKTIYFVLEIFRFLGVDTRLSKDIFRSYFGDRKREPSIVFKLLDLKFLGLDSSVTEREIQYLLQFQKENGGFSFKKINGGINTTFWLVYILDNYSWLLDYNPVGIYSFINSNLSEILSTDINWTLSRLMEVSKLIILLSIVWKKFIDEIERVIFRQLEQEKYIDLNQIKITFGLTHGIEEVISYINRTYTINFKILDNKIEFRNYVQNLSPRKEFVASTIYEQLSKNSIISLSDLVKKYNTKYKYDPIKINDVRLLIHDMMERNFFKGNVQSKKKLLVKTKYYFYLDFFLDKIIVSDTEINTARFYDEKEKLKDIKNDIYNMVLKLKNTSLQIKEEIESYLLLDEIDYAKERLKFLLRDALMEAEFLNENIENSFSEDLYYINAQTILKSEITSWNDLYSILSKKLNEIDSYLKNKIAKKEQIRNLNNTLDKLEEKIFLFSESISRKLDEFREFIKETNEREYSDKGFSLLVQKLENIKTNVNKFDKKIYEISQKITSKDISITQKRKRVINKWVRINEDLNEIFNYYVEGFNFFKENLNKINFLKNDIIQKSNIISEKAQSKVKKEQFVEAFEVIKKEINSLLNLKTREIKDIQEYIKIEIKNKQKLYLLYRHLLERLEVLEENLLSVIQEQEQSLKIKVIEKRNRAIIKDFDTFVSQEIFRFKTVLNSYKKGLNQSTDKKLKDIIKGFNDIKSEFDDANIIYMKKLNNCKELIVNFDEKFNATIIQWANFNEYYKHEISSLKDEYINNMITEKINLIMDEKKTNNVKIMDLKNELGLKCKVITKRIKNMIEISKLNAKLYEAEKCVLIFTDHYYKNKELRNFIESKLLKLMRKKIGKILALYDSSIKTRTLSVSMLEIQNRINDLTFKENIRHQFDNKVKELQIQIESRKEYLETKNYLESVIKNNKLAINTINNNLILFTNLQNFIKQEFNNLTSELSKNYSKTYEEIEKSRGKSYLKVKENFLRRWRKLEEQFKQTQERIEEELKLSLNETNDSYKLGSEIGEFFVKKKNAFIKEYEEKKEKINAEILILKDEALRGKLITYVNNRKSHLNYLLGTLQARVEDDIEVKEFKRANHKIQKRAKNIVRNIKIIKKNIKNNIKEFNKQSINFETKNKYIIKDFDQFLKNFKEILSEKVKSLERLIIKSYVKMAIKAVANEFLTINFLYEEIKIKKSNIQSHLILLISDGELKGKYYPRFGIYYENPEILNDLDETELEVIKTINFKLYMFLRRLKNFASQYGSIIGFFASILAIIYYFYVLSGGNPAIVAIPIALVSFLIFYLIFKRRKED